MSLWVLCQRVASWMGVGQLLDLDLHQPAGLERHRTLGRYRNVHHGSGIAAIRASLFAREHSEVTEFHAIAPAQFGDYFVEELLIHTLHDDAVDPSFSAIRSTSSFLVVVAMTANLLNPGTSRREALTHPPLAKELLPPPQMSASSSFVRPLVKIALDKCLPAIGEDGGGGGHAAGAEDACGTSGPGF